MQDESRAQSPLDTRMRNLHEVLKSAALHTRGPENAPMIPRSVKFPPGLTELADKICERNNTTLSGYLRECTEQLVREYGVPEPLINQ